ncbi:MAG: hypothetical protein ACKESB_03190 [Candidatus Hodgkinia cicadicola]
MHWTQCVVRQPIWIYPDAGPQTKTLSAAEARLNAIRQTARGLNPPQSTRA